MAKRSYKFTDKKHTRQGIASTALGVLALLLMAAVLLQAYRRSGAAGSLIGLLGLFSMLAAAAGFTLAMRGLQEEDVYYLFSLIGVCMNGLLFVLWILIFILGM
jgi:hypothetical protein